MEPELDEKGSVNSFISIFPRAFHHSAPSPPRFKTLSFKVHPPKLLSITPGFSELTHVYFRTRGVGSSEVSWPSKARHPVLNLGTFLSIGLFCLLRPLGVRVPVPWRLVRTPRVSGHFAASPRH